MRFQVPQFIEIEDKIFGPLTLKQFIYLAGVGGLGFMLFRYLPLLISIPLILVAGGFGLALAFYRVNNKPFLFVIQSAVSYFFSSKLYIWKKSDKKPERREAEMATIGNREIAVPKLSDSKLKDITWSLDINENIEK